MTQAVQLDDVVCPFCSMGCDDLKVARQGPVLRVVENGCRIARDEFVRTTADTSARIEGAPVSLVDALDRAATILRASKLPVFAGLGTDTAGLRAATALAERVGGILDHAGGAGISANMGAMRTVGWVTATLAEVRNRSDLVLFVGTDTSKVAPRFVERCLTPTETLFGPIARKLIYLGSGIEPAVAFDTTHLPCPPRHLPEVVAMLRALVHERRPKVESLHGIPVDELAATAKQLRESHYATIVWSVAELPGPHADLTVQQIAKLLQELNVTGRAVGVPLVGARNPIGANQVAAWQTGLPLPVSLSAGVPDHDPWLYAVRPALTDGGDCLVWIGSFTGSAAPPEDVPTIALVRGGTVSPHEPTVVIPVGTPGIDHAGSVYRTDSVVALPLRKLRDTGLPSVADVLGALAARLEGAAC